MNPTPPLVLCTETDLNEYLARQAIGPIERLLNSAGPMQRLRVTTLPDAVMEQLCQSLQDDSRWVVKLLTSTVPDQPWKATATKLIEMRNTLEKPLLVFIPHGLRTAAEDSLDVATFSELSLSGLSRNLPKLLLDNLSPDLQLGVRDILEYLRLEKVIRHEDLEVGYLLTILKNGDRPEVAGKALCVLGLLPDAVLFHQANPRRRLSQNHKAAEELADINRPLRERIGRLPIKAGTIQDTLFAFLRSRHTDAPRLWSSEIACNPEYAGLSLEHWHFNDGEEQGLRLVLDPLNLPIQTPDEVGGAAQMPVLDLQGKQGLKVSIRSFPKPAEVPAWRTFRVQILSYGEEGEVVSWESNNFPKPAGKNQKFSRTIKLSDLQELEEGTYYLKVDAYDQNGALLTQRRPIDPEHPQGRSENESDYFLLTRGSTEIEPPQPRVIHVPSLIDAYAAISARNIGSKSAEDPPNLRTATGCWNQSVQSSVRGDVYFELRGEPWVGYGIVLPGLFRKLELTILDHSDQLGFLRLELSEAKSIADLQPEQRDHSDLPSCSELDAFLQARSAIFAGITDQHRRRFPDTPDTGLLKGVVETSDLLEIGDLIQAYADSYQLLAEKSLLDGRSSSTSSGMFGPLSQLDLVELHWRRSAGDPGRALLLAPTHPMRLLWHVQRAHFLSNIIAQARDGGKVPSWPDFFQEIREEIVPLNLPMVLFDRKGRAYLDQGCLTNHWSLYLPDRSETERAIDTSACRDRVRSHLGLRGKSALFEPVDSREIASRILTYVIEHPYVEQLRINVFNPGDGQVIVDALREVERDQNRLKVPSETGLLRYSVQMFSSGAEYLEGMGESLESLLDPDRQVAEDDEFTLNASNHLLPKLVFARNSVDDFLQHPKEYPAHLTIFLEFFHARSRLGRIGKLRRGSYVGGLIQEPEITRDNDESRTGWVRGLRPGAARDAGPREERLGQILTLTQRLVAASASGQPQDPEVAPIVSLHLDGPSTAVLKLAHDFSDWVITVDRSLGVDYFDSGMPSEDLGYLLDYAPETLQADLPQIMLTTRSTAELIGFLGPAFEELGIHLLEHNSVIVLRALRSLSGRLALRLLATPSRTREIMGLLFARWLMERAGLLEDRVIIPLDAHLGWFRQRDSSGDSVELANQRADLLLVGLEPAEATITFTVVEIKMRESLTHGERAFLYRTMREQAEATESCLRRRFDPALYTDPRVDSSICAKELGTLLAFYIKRAQRYGLFASEHVDESMEFAENLDAGYRLELRSVGVVFERQAKGAHVDEDEPGFTVHRFGFDVAAQLVVQACQTVRVDTTNEPHEMPEASPCEKQTGVPEITEDVLDTFRTSIGAKLSSRRRERKTEPGEDAKSPTSQWPSHEEANEQAQASHTRNSEGAEATAEVVHSEEQEKHELRDTTSCPLAATGVQPDAHIPADEDSVISSEFRSRSPISPQASAQSAVAELVPSSLNSAPVSRLVPDVLLGASELTAQYGLIGRSGTATVAVDLTGCNTISLFGVQGFGKSYTMGVIAEMSTKAVPGINWLQSPLATVIFHYHKSDSYPPEFATCIGPNKKAPEVDRLTREYGATPQGLRDVLLLAPAAKVADRRHEFPGIEVQPIQFNSGELGAESWKFLLGAYGNDSLYVRQLVAMMRRYRGSLTLDYFDREIRQAELTNAVRRLAEDRIALARPYINDSADMASLLRPGCTIIVDLRDEWIEKEEALGLFVVMLRIFANSRFEGRRFNKLVVFDEAHKYITESDLIGQVVETIREMRHQATSVLIASQDPLSVPRAVIELTSLLILHRMTSPQWLKHLKSAISALDQLTESNLATLMPGEALVWRRDRRIVGSLRGHRRLQYGRDFRNTGEGLELRSRVKLFGRVFGSWRCPGHNPSHRSFNDGLLECGKVDCVAPGWARKGVSDLVFAASRGPAGFRFSRREQFGVSSVFVENRTDTNYREEAHHHLGDVLANRIIRLLEFPGQLIELLLAIRAILPSRVEGRDDLLDVLVSVRGSGCSLRACVRVSGLLAGDNRTHLG